MGYFARTFSRQVTNAMPAWRTAMSATDKVYTVGGLPSNAGTELVWPAAGQGGVLMSGGGDANTSMMHYSYGGSVFVPDLGTHGAMVFGATGEGSIHPQLTQFTMSEDAPRWRMFQQPDFATSLAQANARDADWYWSPSEYAALSSSLKIDIVGENAFAAAWDGTTFPVGYKDWIARRKAGPSILGNNVPHFFRYNMPRYIPASMTGTGAGAIITNTRGTQYGPFSQGPMPAGTTPEGRWFADSWGGGSDRRKHYLFAMDVQTKAWQRLTNTLPDFAGYVDLASPYSCVDTQNKRVYYSTYNGSNHALYYASFASGLSGMTIVGPTNLTDLASGPGMSQAANCVLAVPTSGPNAGRRLWYLRDAGATPALLLIDIDNNTLRKLTITGLPSAAEWWCFAYRASTNEIIISTKQPSLGLAKSYRIAIPTDPTSAAGYSVTATTLTLDTGVTIEDVGGWQYGERNAYIDSLGVIFFTQRDQRMLAYRPGT